MASKNKLSLAIDLGGTSAKMAMIDTEGAIHHRWSLPTDIRDQGRYIVSNLIQSIHEQLTILDLDLLDIKGIGMGTPGIVLADGSVKGAYNLNWATAFPVKESFNLSLPLPFYLTNDANAAALGEQWLGAGAGHQSLVMVTLGTGIGGGIVSGGRLIEGSWGSAGEIGHLTIDTSRTYRCTCGKYGCLESVASATGLVNLLDHYAQESIVSSELLKDYRSGAMIDAKQIINAAKSGDLLALQIFDEFSHYLALACSHIANILNPELILIGGGVSMAGEFLIHAIKEKYLNYVYPPIKEQTQIALANLGNDAGLIGAAALVIRNN